MLLAIIFSLSIGGFAYYVTISLTTDIEVLRGGRGTKIPCLPPHKIRLLYGSPTRLTFDIKADTKSAVLVLDNFLDNARNARLLSREL
jgi:hypothetical protein